jgi:diacylglycerol kinase
MQPEPNKFSLNKRLKSFTYAFNGLKGLWNNEHNLRIHIIAAILAILLGFYFQISTTEWIIVVLLIGMVIAAEIFNSAVEHLADFVMPNMDSRIGKIKDLSAAAVLVIAFVAFIIGLIIFLPKLLAMVF